MVIYGGGICFLDVTFDPRGVCGIFSQEVNLEILKPTRQTITVHLKAFSILSFGQQPLAPIRHLLAHPFPTMTQLNAESTSPAPIPPPNDDPIEVLEWSTNKVLTLFGGVEDAESVLPAQTPHIVFNPSSGGRIHTIKLQNISEDLDPLPYHLCVSGPFQLLCPLDGVLQAGEELLVPIRLNYAPLERGNPSCLYVGSVAAFSNQSDAPFALCTLHGHYKDLVWLDVGESLHFPPCRVGETSTRHVCLRNTSIMEVDYEIQFQPHPEASKMFSSSPSKVAVIFSFIINGKLIEFLASINC